MLAQDDDGLRPLPLLFAKGSTTESIDAEYVKIVLGHVLTLDEFRLAAPRQTELARSRGCRHTREALGLLSIVEIVGVRDRRAQPHDATLFLDHRYGTNEDDVDDTEDRRVETDA